jgi:uncharacterized membrane-anchored protein YjiN (DUF445 family)
MGLFGLRKKDDFIDLGEKYKKQQERVKEIKEDTKENQEDEPAASRLFGMFGGGVQPVTTEEDSSQENLTEKKRKLAKRLMDMTDKIEDLSNKIYHLEQRIEILESRSRD